MLNLKLLFSLQCKLIDYDLAKENYAECWSAQNPCGTAEFMAPEIVENKLYTLVSMTVPFHGDKHLLQEIDIWSLGCVLYGMLAGHCPFRGANNLETRCNILNKKIDMDALNTASTEVKDLIKQMLEPDPEKRLTAQGVQSHNLIQNLMHSARS